MIEFLILTRVLQPSVWLWTCSQGLALCLCVSCPAVGMLSYCIHAYIDLSHYWNLHMKYYNVCTLHLEHS